MSGVAIHITLEPKSGRPVSLARLSDSETLRHVARAAVNRARANAEAARDVDWLLGQMRSEEASALERYFRLLIPGFGGGRELARLAS